MSARIRPNVIEAFTITGTTALRAGARTSGELRPANDTGPNGRVNLLVSRRRRQLRRLGRS